MNPFDDGLPVKLEMGSGSGEVISNSAATALEAGMYRIPFTDVLYRVYPARSGTHLLAKMLAPTDDGGWRFEYAGAASRFVASEDRMSVEEARAWGRDTGFCCLCGAVLTDPDSIQRGTGPICDGRA